MYEHVKNFPHIINFDYRRIHLFYERENYHFTIVFSHHFQICFDFGMKNMSIYKNLIEFLMLSCLYMQESDLSIIEANYKYNPKFTI